MDSLLIGSNFDDFRFSFESATKSANRLGLSTFASICAPISPGKSTSDDGRFRYEFIRAPAIRKSAKACLRELLGNTLSKYLNLVLSTPLITSIMYLSFVTSREELASMQESCFDPAGMNP